MNGMFEFVLFIVVELFGGFPSILKIFLTYDGSVPLITNFLFTFLKFLTNAILSSKKNTFLPLLQTFSNQLSFEIFNDIIITFKIVYNE